MYIIPLEVKPSWRNVPIVTLVVVILNLALYAWHSQYDKKIEEQALEYYSSSGLDRDEFEDLKRFLLDKTEFGYTESYFKRAETDPYIKEELAMMAYYYRDFSQTIRDQRFEKVADDPAYLPLYNAWLEKRLALDALYKKSITGRFAYTPGNNNPVTWITSVFMHGSWGHVIGNMVFLLLFGWGLEFILGSLLYLFVYLATGAIAAVTFGAFNINSLIPLVGASGAVSGVMGAYIGYFRTRKINFFYNFAFYFGKIRAPALLVLGFYLLKELYGTFFADDNVAYLAHFGGFLGGAGIVYLLSLIQEKVIAKRVDSNDHQARAMQFGSEQFHEYQEEEDKRNKLKDAKLAINQSLEALDLDLAERKTFKVLEEFGHDLALWQTLYQTASIRAHAKSYQQTTLAIVKHFLKEKSLTAADIDFLRDLLLDYEKRSPKKLLLSNAGILSSLSELFIRKQDTLGAKLTMKYLLAAENDSLSGRAKQLAQGLHQLLMHSRKIADVRYREKLELLIS